MIEIRGVGIERFINTLHANHIALFQLQRFNRTTLQGCAYTRDKKRILQLAEESRCRVAVRKEYGLPQKLAVFKRRWLFVLGAFIFCASIYASTRFVWQVDIIGAEDAAHAAKVREQICEMGFGPGSLWTEMDTAELKRRLMLQNDWVAYVLVNRIGAKLEIELIPENPKPQQIQKDVPCDIVAAREAVVYAIQALDGLPNVSVGQVVHPGDVLIQGAFPREEGAARLVAARGTVQGKIVYQGVATAAAQTVEMQRTGRMAVERTLVLCGCEIELESIPFAEYDMLETEYTQVSSSFLPAYIRSRKVAETKATTVRLNEEQMYSRALKEAEKKVQKQIPEGVEVIEKQIVAQTNQAGEVTVKVFWETVEEIGIPRYYGLEEAVERERNHDANERQDTVVGDGACAFR